MTRFACTPAETSCLLSNLFTELRPVCGRCGGDAVVLCGLTYEGEEQVVVLRDYGFDYSGRAKRSRESGNEGVSMGTRQNYQRNQRKTDGAENPLHVLPVASNLIDYTLNLTDNTKHFPKKVRFTLVNRIQDHVLSIYEKLLAANEIYPIRSAEDKARRLTLQRDALTACKMLLFFIELSKKRGYIDKGTFEYWTKITLDVKFMAAAWYKAEQAPAEKAEKAGPEGAEPPAQAEG